MIVSDHSDQIPTCLLLQIFSTIFSTIHKYINNLYYKYCSSINAREIKKVSETLTTGNWAEDSKK